MRSRYAVVCAEVLALKETWKLPRLRTSMKKTKRVIDVEDGLDGDLRGLFDIGENLDVDFL